MECLQYDGLPGDVDLRPLRITIRRGRRVLVGGATVRMTDGTVHDQFVQWTEGVIAYEDADDVHVPGRAGSSGALVAWPGDGRSAA